MLPKEEFICTNCKQECRVVVVDFGIGHYEYAGATGWDSKLESVSNCCEAPVINKKTLKRVELSDLEPDEPTYWYEDY